MTPRQYIIAHPVDAVDFVQQHLLPRFRAAAIVPNPEWPVLHHVRFDLYGMPVEIERVQRFDADVYMRVTWRDRDAARECEGLTPFVAHVLRRFW